MKRTIKRLGIEKRVYKGKRSQPKSKLDLYLNKDIKRVSFRYPLTLQDKLVAIYKIIKA